jgi:hypothetical protein
MILASHSTVPVIERLEPVPVILSGQEMPQEAAGNRPALSDGSSSRTETAASTAPRADEGCSFATRHALVSNDYGNQTVSQSSLLSQSSFGTGILSDFV